jgi:Rrf2 family transcriptional regulator, cysteine metabolism repressor
MRISARVSYACYALLELSMHWPEDNPVQIHQIAKKQSIPIKYLILILLQLKQLGLIRSIRGKKGGYLLARAPNTITLARFSHQPGFVQIQGA